MADNRSRRQKLEAMANQTASPHEAEIARRKLKAMGHEPPKARQQQAPPRSSYEDVFRTWYQGEFDPEVVRQRNEQQRAYEEAMREELRRRERAYQDEINRAFFGGGRDNPYFHWTSTSSRGTYYPPGSRGEDPLGHGRPAGFGWNPKAYTEEPHWFAQWFGDQLRRQGADERDVEHALSEMRIKNGWSLE